MRTYKCRYFPRFHFGTIVLNLYKLFTVSGDFFSKAKLFADDASLFTVAHNINTSANELNYNLKISNCAFQQKIIFNPDPSKQVREVMVEN